MKEAGSGCRGDRRPCGRQVTVAAVRGTRSWRQRPRRSWPEPTPAAVGLSCDGCRGSGDPAVGLGGWGVSGSRGRRRGGGGGARARRGLPHVRGDGGPGGEAEATPLRGGAPSKEQSEAPVQVRALPLAPGAGWAQGTLLLSEVKTLGSDPHFLCLLAQERNFCTERGEVSRLGHFAEKVNKFCNGLGKTACPFLKTYTHHKPNTNLVLKVIKYPQ